MAVLGIHSSEVYCKEVKHNSVRFAGIGLVPLQQASLETLDKWLPVKNNHPY